jgi:hypothetical protein
VSTDVNRVSNKSASLIDPIPLPDVPGSGQATLL